MDCEIYPIVDEDVMDVPFPKAKMAYFSVKPGSGRTSANDIASLLTVEESLC